MDEESLLHGSFMPIALHESEYKSATTYRPIQARV